MSVRVAVLAEGPADDAGEITLLPAPGDNLQEEHLGPAHIVVRRTIARESRVPEGAVCFVSPLRVRARRHRASELVDPKSLRRLLTWPLARMAPRLGIVIVDEDGNSRRRRELQEFTQDIELPHVIVVPVREFEAWLIGDASVVRELLDNEAPAQPEKMSPREAKQLLESWTSARDIGVGDKRERRRILRLELAKRCNLDTLDRLTAFAVFAKDVRQAMAALAG